jgi:branched-chain amino acid transport system substrate-binding protein
VTRPPESLGGLNALSKTPLIVAYPNVAVTADSRFCREKLFRTTETGAMTARAAAAYVDGVTDTERIALLGRQAEETRDPVGGYVLQASSFLSARNTSVASERTLPLEMIFEKNRNDGWTSELDRIESAGADALLVDGLIFNLDPPRIVTDFLRDEYSFRLVSVWPSHGQVVRLGEVIESVLGASFDAEDLANRNLGPFVSRYHWNQYEGTTARSFVDTFTDTYGRVPDTRTSAAFAAGRALDMAVQASRSTDGEELAGALRGASIARTPKGTDGYTFQRYNNQAQSPMTLAPPVPTAGDVEGWDAAVMPGEPVATISAKTAALPADSDLMNCSL